MALSWYTYPNLTYRQSVSFPFRVIVTASMYGAANVTQHRVKAVIKEGTTEIVTKYTIVYDETLKLAKIDFSEAASSVLPISTKDLTAGADITKITTLQPLEIPSQKAITIELTEQYYLSGVFTSSATISLTYDMLRGWTDITALNNRHLYGNWWQINGLDNFMPFSGKIHQVYPTRAEDTSWQPVGTHPWLDIRIYNGAAVTPSFTLSYARTDMGILYFPIFLAGVSDQASFEYWTVVIATSVTSGAMTYIEEYYLIRKNVDDCEGEGETIMFQDRLQTWAFMHFPKKSRTTVTTKGMTGELPVTADDPGRFKYNVDSSDVLALNTDWMQEEQNPLIQDLIASESTWLVDPSDGSLEQVTVVPNSVRLKKRSTDNMIMYGMSFRKSVNNFKP